MATVKPAQGLKPLRFRRVWLTLWAVAMALVIVVCLIPGPDLPDLPENSDKIEHFASYFLLALAAVQLFAGRRALSAAGLGLLALGVGIEFAQGAWTTTRSADVLDAFADAAGIVAGLSLALTPARDLLIRLEKRLPF